MRKHMEKQKGIQTTLFDYFNDTEYFTIQEANDLVLEHQKRDEMPPVFEQEYMKALKKGCLSVLEKAYIQ